MFMSTTCNVMGRIWISGLMTSDGDRWIFIYWDILPSLRQSQAMGMICYHRYLLGIQNDQPEIINQDTSKSSDYYLRYPTEFESGQRHDQRYHNSGWSKMAISSPRRSKTHNSVKRLIDACKRYPNELGSNFWSI